MEKEKKVVRDVVKEFCYYDAGSDYFFEGAIVIDETTDIGFSDIQFREGDYDVKYIHANKEDQAKWDDFRLRQKESFEKWNKVFSDCKNGLTCPVCGSDKRYGVKNDWALKELGTREADFCSNCKSNICYSQNPITTNYCITIKQNFKTIAKLSNRLGVDCVERYLENPEDYDKDLQQFKENLKLIEVEQK